MPFQSKEGKKFLTGFGARMRLRSAPSSVSLVPSRVTEEGPVRVTLTAAAPRPGYSCRRPSGSLGGSGEIPLPPPTTF